MKIAVFSLLVCVLLSGCSSDRISQVVAFGDSYSDNGKILQIVKEAVDKGEFSEEILKWAEAYYWEGRLSNGPVAVEVLAERLNVDLKDYAISGAKSGYDDANGIASLKNAGLLGQIDKYKTDLNGEKADPEALYFLQVSTNDFLGTEDYTSQAITDLADQVVANLVTAVSGLANLGAKQFLVGKSSDLTRVPEIMNRGLIPEATTFQNRMNAKLIDEMARLEQQLDIKIDSFDYTALNDAIWNNPDQYGIKNLAEQCLVTDENGSSTVCEAPDEYYWWDTVHPTRRGHQIIGEAMADQISK